MPARRRGLKLLDVTRPLRAAIGKLQVERDRIDQQITGIQRALAVLSGTQQAKKEGPSQSRAPRRQSMSTKARKALSQRMRAYWAKRRAAAAKEMPKA